MESLSTVEKAVELLYHLHESPAPQGVTAIGRALGVPKSSAHRLLTALSRRGLVEQDGRGRYGPGIGLVALGLGALEREPVVAAARPVLEQEADALGETFFLVGSRAGRLVVLDKAEGSGFLRAAPRVGSSVPVHATAAGKLYLAFAPEALAPSRGALERFTPRTLRRRRRARARGGAGAPARLGREPRGVDSGPLRARRSGPGRRAARGSRRSSPSPRPRPGCARSARPRWPSERSPPPHASRRGWKGGPHDDGQGVDRRQGRGGRAGADPDHGPRAALRRRHLRGDSRLRQGGSSGSSSTSRASPLRRGRSRSSSRAGSTRCASIVRDTVRAHGTPDAYVRLIATRGDGALGVDPTSCPQPRVLCLVDRVSIFPPEKLAVGLDLVTVSLRRPPPDVLDPRVKSLNYLNSVLAKLEARQRGADEALILNLAGNIAEASVANVFVVRGGELRTPPATDGALEGITRQTVFELAGTLGIPAREQTLGRFDLFAAEEAFLTGTGAGIVPVRSLDGRPVGERPTRARSARSCAPPTPTRPVRWEFRCSTAARAPGTPPVGSSPPRSSTMRWSQSFIPTLRDDPADAEAISHKLLVRAGYIRQLMSGVYSLLPLGFAVARKITAIVRTEMNAIGAQEFHLPALHPAELWQRSGRWELVGEEMFRLKDRRGADTALGMTHEEVFTTLAVELRSYRQLPQIWFQLQTKFRDEPRPKSGLLRVREFTMKDSYSFDLDAAGLDESFQKHFHAYRRIFSRCGLETLAVEASSGAMGGSESVEFMLASDAGEDWVASCAACGYAANVEKARSLLPACEDGRRPRRARALRHAGRAHDRRSRGLRGEPHARLPARSRRSSTGSTARRCWCCCAATISWSRPSCATRPAPPRRGRPRSRDPRRAGRPRRAASAPWA